MVWDGTHPRDGFNETGLSSTLIANDDDAGELEVNVSAEEGAT